MSIHLYVFILIIAAPAWASAISLTVEEAAEYALRHNPTLAAARLRIEEARGRLQQSGRFSNPELEIGYSHNTMGRESSADISLMQRFPITARLRYEKAVSRAELAAAEAEVRDAERKLSQDVSGLAIKLLALGGQRELRSKQLTNSQELSTFLLKRVETGEASTVDASQVELESRQIEIENLQLAADEVLLLGDLRSMLGLRGDDRIVITGQLAPPGNSPVSRTVAGRPDILAAESRAAAARSSVLEQRARRWEDIGVGVSYTRERTVDEPEPIETEQMVGFRVSVPLPIWNNNAGRIREATAAAARAEKEVDAVRLTANSEVIAALSAMGAYAKVIAQLDEKVLPTATRIEEQFRNSYTTGQSPLTEVLRARTRRLELQRQRLDAVRDYHLARIRHTAATYQANLPSKSYK